MSGELCAKSVWRCVCGVYACAQGVRGERAGMAGESLLPSGVCTPTVPAGAAVAGVLVTHLLHTRTHEHPLRMCGGAHACRNARCIWRTRMTRNHLCTLPKPPDPISSSSLYSL